MFLVKQSAKPVADNRPRRKIQIHSLPVADGAPAEEQKLEGAGAADAEMRNMDGAGVNIQPKRNRGKPSLL